MFFQIVIVCSFHECRVPRVGLEDDGTPSFHLAQVYRSPWSLWTSMGSCLCGCIRAAPGTKLQVLVVSDGKGTDVAPSAAHHRPSSPRRRGPVESRRARAESIIRAVAKAPPQGATQWSPRGAASAILEPSVDA